MQDWIKHIRLGASRTPSSSRLRLVITLKVKLCKNVLSCLNQKRGFGLYVTAFHPKKILTVHLKYKKRVVTSPKRDQCNRLSLWLQCQHLNILNKCLNDKQTKLKAAWVSFMSIHLFSPSARKSIKKYLVRERELKAIIPFLDG